MQRVATTAEGRSSGWLARSTIAGFAALAISTVVLVVAFAFAGALGEIYRASGVPAAWMYGLTHNQIVEQGRGQVFGSLALHLALGMFWAIVYGSIVAPRLRDWPTWQRGAVFALIPWALSITIIPMQLGAGLAYGDLGAGPLPV